MSSSEPERHPIQQYSDILLKIARSSISNGLETGRPLEVDLAPLPELLREPGATFVTLELNGQLRGCIGTLIPRQPVAEDTAENAFNAAFRDPRFPQLTPAEFRKIDIAISVLTLPEPMSFDSEEDLKSQIRPGIDGLIIESGWNRGTFLPAVWESLPETETFLKHLKMKAGLAPDYWSDDIKVSRYEAIKLS